MENSKLSVVPDNYPVPGLRYEHFRGNYYTVVGLAVDSEYPNKDVVIYREEGSDVLWTRLVANWLQRVDGVPRFRCTTVGWRYGRTNTHIK